MINNTNVRVKIKIKHFTDATVSPIAWKNMRDLNLAPESRLCYPYNDPALYERANVHHQRRNKKKKK